MIRVNFCAYRGPSLLLRSEAIGMQHLPKKLLLVCAHGHTLENPFYKITFINLENRHLDKHKHNAPKLCRLIEHVAVKAKCCICIVFVSLKFLHSNVSNLEHGDICLVWSLADICPVFLFLYAYIHIFFPGNCNLISCVTWLVVIWTTCPQCKLLFRLFN